MSRQLIAGLKKFYRKLFGYFTICVTIIVIYMIYLKLTNHSPTVEELTFGLVVALIGWQVSLTVGFYNLRGEMKEFKRNTITAFGEVRGDIREMRTDILQLRSEVIELRYEFKSMKSDMSSMKSDISLIKKALKIHN